MALLIDIGTENWMSDAEVAAELTRHLPDADIRTRANPGDAGDITMLAVSALRKNAGNAYPNLRLVQKLGAGVETIVRHPALPDHVRVARLKPEAPAREIAEWFLTYILLAHRQVQHYRDAQNRSDWAPVAPHYSPDTTVGVLGLGHIGGYTARMFRSLGFRTLGWSRSPKEMEGINCTHGPDSLPDMVSQCDHLCAILPSTAETTHLFDASLLAAMKPGSQLLNAGRGSLIDEADLIAALDLGRPGRAVLDVLHQEPLPPDSPLWSHPRVTITPHVSGWHLGDALEDVAENYRRLTANEPLLHEVDRARGY